MQRLVVWCFGIFSMAPIALAVDLNSVAPSVPDGELDASVSTYYSTSVSGQRDATHKEFIGATLLASTKVFSLLNLELAVAGQSARDDEERQWKLQNTVVTASPDPLPLTSSLSFIPSIYVTLPTNEDDRDYLSYRGDIGVAAALMYKSPETFLGTFRGGGNLEFNQGYYEYDASKGGDFNSDYGYTYGVLGSLTKGPVAVGLFYNTSQFILTNGDDVPLVYTHGVYLSYQVTKNLTVKIQEGMQDKVYGFDETSMNVRFYDKEFTRLTGSATYKF